MPRHHPSRLLTKQYVKLQQHRIFPPPSSSKPCVLRNSIGATRVSCKRVAHLDYLLSNWGNSRKCCLARLAVFCNGGHSLSFRTVGFRKLNSACPKTRRFGYLLPLASADDGATVNGSPSASTAGDVDEMRVKLTQSLQGEDYGDRLVQSLHDAARVVELAIKEQGLLSKSWFSTSWLGVDRKAWGKTLSYQISVYSLLQAACEISSRGDSRDRDINVFVQKSLLRQSAPLESLIRDKLSAKQPEAYEWLLSEQVPVVVTSFVNYFEGDQRFSAATAVFRRRSSEMSGNGSDISLLLLALTCNAAITKLGPTKVSCPQFFSMVSDITGRLMDMLVHFIPISQAYHSVKDIGLRREFLVHLGPRAAACRVKNDHGSEEVVFWVDLIQKQLLRAIDREKIWSRLTTSESIEVLEKDLAIFGFFIALGRSTQSFLSANGFDVIHDPVESFIRHLIGGSVLYYPQLSSISSYQLYVEVVCEELDWLPFYSSNVGTANESKGHKTKIKGPPNAEVIPQVLDVCSHWIQSFIKYSIWLENPTNVKAAKFLSRAHAKLTECMEELRMPRQMGESDGSTSLLRAEAGICSINDKERDSFDKALESVEEALIRLENVLQDLHVSSSNSGKEELKAACSDLEKIRKLKKEAEFLEASFRAKAASLRQDNHESKSPSSVSEQQQFLEESVRKSASGNLAKRRSKFQGVWNTFWGSPSKKPDSDLPDNESALICSCMSVYESSSVISEGKVRFRMAKALLDMGVQRLKAMRGGSVLLFVGHKVVKLAWQMQGDGETTSSISPEESELNEISRFEVLRNELMELEKRVQKSTESEIEEDIKVEYSSAGYLDDMGNAQLVQVQKKENIIQNSLDKLKRTSTVLPLLHCHHSEASVSFKHVEAYVLDVIWPVIM
ncbi:hypothetical protein Tsubulata_009674 [Turnera subulata]|uniref:LETM1-like protein n=1 Tax=Turnera subulata TaxID=218843 RepID=A0A9Q0FEI9_9ROSI|nr:hypothetical protein Tsubulata_009674 [Turnera subulata]